MNTTPFNDAMWSAFAGSERWSNDCPPLFSKGNFSDAREFVLVLDRTGCCLVVDGDDEINMAGGRVLAMPFPTQQAAMAFARGIPAPRSVDDFLALGFKEL